MPDFICLLLANNEVIVCSRYVATQMLDVVIKQVLTYMYHHRHDTDLPAGCGNIFSFQSNFCHAIIPVELSFFDVEVKPDQKSEELHFPSVIFQLYSGAHLI